MRKQCLAVVIGCCLMSACPPFLAALDIVKDGAPAARIVVPDDADPYTKLAAEWIQTYVKRGTGATLPIVAEGNDQSAGPRICVGATKAAASAGIRGDQIKWDGCRLTVKGDTLFLLGHDEPGVGKADYKAPKGTCRAAVAFLEDFCGVRWLAPSPIGDVVPTQKDIAVPADLDRTFVPAFLYGTGRLIYGAKTPAAYANNFREALRLFTVGGHTWNEWVPVKKYFNEHPEYFALINGQRSSTDWNHLCTTNPDVKRLLLEGLRGKFNDGYDWAQLGQSDGYRRCECAACDALDNFRSYAGTEEFIYKTLRENPCERILLLHRDLAEECAKSHPDKIVHLLVYGPTRWPSKKFDKFPDNVVLELCDQDPRVIEAWQGKAKAFTAYVYYWGTYNAPGPGPKYTPAQVAESLRFMRDNRIIGVYFCGIGECWGLEGHSYYVCGKLLGNPDLDPRMLVEEYCNGLYGKAAPAMRRFLEALDERVRLYADALKRSRLLNNPESVYTEMYPPAVVNRLGPLLRQAEALADDDRSKAWVRLARISFDFVKLTANAYTQYRAFQGNQNREILVELKKAVEQWRAHRDTILNLSKSDIANWFPGHAAWADFFKTGGHLNSVIRAPFDWDFDRMIQKYASTAPKGPAALVAPRLAQPPTIDGLIGADEWQSASPADINLLTGGAASVPTKLRVAFDEKNLYVAFVCSEPQIEKLRLGQEKRDGGIWNMDCAEIFLDLEAGGSKYFHFIMAPARNAFYDARRGFIQDTLNPLYDKDDPSWNPDWRYAFTVDAAKKEWVIEAELPFASLGCEPPSSGVRWKANFGRERYAGLTGGNDPELFLWSPNELGNGFCEPLCFGDLYFEKAK